MGADSSHNCGGGKFTGVCGSGKAVASTGPAYGKNDGSNNEPGDLGGQKG